MTSTHGTRHICGFIPPYLLEHMATSPDVEPHVCTAAEKTLQHSHAPHVHRSNTTPVTQSARSGFIPQYLLRNLANSQQTDGEHFSAREALDKQEQAQKKGGQLKVKREVYDMKHSDDENGLPGTFITSDAKPATSQYEHTVFDCLENLGTVYRFYAEVFKRDSIDDKGMVLTGCVHFGTDYQNAFWDGKEMVFGDGGFFLNNFTDSLDVVGHELTHGVTEHAAGLIYENQAGALNESISDCFGSMIRQYKFKETVDEADWLIGEDSVLPDIKGVALRSMKMPGTAYDDPRIGKDPQPAHMKDFKNLPNTPKGDNGGVHYNSGIPNRAFYLAATGLGGHSWEKAGPIWYGTINSDKIKNDCNFKEFANITIDVAKQLYGEKEAKVVTDAWTTVGVL